LTTPDALAGDSALNPGNSYPDWQQAVAARSALGPGFYRLGRLSAPGRCPPPVPVCDQAPAPLSDPPRPPAGPAPPGELVRLPGGHYQPFLAGHGQAAEAELSFLRRHLLDSAADRPGHAAAGSAHGGGRA